MVKTIAVLNQKGGVGKTTTAISLAAYMTKAGKSVLLIDFDPQGNATSGLGLTKNNISQTTYELLLGQVTLAQTVVKTALTRLDVVPSNANLAAAEIDLASMANRERILQQRIGEPQYDIVLIDCPPALGLLTINALVAADYLLIPVQAEYYALEGLGQLLSVFQRVKQGLNPRIEILGVVVTMYDKRTSLAEQVYRELEKHFNEKVFKSVIPRNVRLAEAPSYGRSIVEHDKWSKGARAYKQLTKEVLSRV